MTELSIWAKLDVNRAMREIEAVRGHQVFSKWSELDIQRYCDDLRAEFDITITPQMLLDGQSLNDAVSSLLVGPPDDELTELVFVDFVNGVYRIGGETVTLTDVVKFDDAGDWGTANPDLVVSGHGFKAANSGNYPRFTDAVQASILASGFTLVAEFLYTPENPGVSSDGMSFDLELYSADYNENFYGFVQGADGDGQGTIGDGTHTDTTVGGPSTAAGTFKFAVTMLASNISASFDGREVKTVTPDAPATLHYVGFNVTRHANTLDDDNYLRTITIYTPQNDDVLPGLSAAD